MRNLIRNMKPYKGLVLVMLVLLIVQAWADMSMPQYTSDIIDTGIQNKGIEHILPEEILEDEYESAQIFMDDGQKSDWQNAYRKTDKTVKGETVYQIKDLSEEKLDSLDDELLTPIVLTYELGHMSVSQYKKILVQSMSNDPATAQMASQIQGMTIDQIKALPNMDIKTFKAGDENGKVKT